MRDQYVQRSRGGAFFGELPQWGIRMLLCALHAAPQAPCGQSSFVWDLTLMYLFTGLLIRKSDNASNSDIPGGSHEALPSNEKSI